MTAVPSTTAGATPERWRVRDILDWTTAHLARHGSDTPRLDTEILLAQARGCRRIELYTHYDEVLSDEERSVMRDLVRRRTTAEPVAYLVGFREFFGLDFRVTPDVLIPRPDTETLLVAVLERAGELTSPLRILDLGTGSGCIAISLATQLPAARITATDNSPAALQIAAANAETHGVADRISFLEGDLYAPLQDEDRFEFIASNPPYIRHDEIATLAEDIRNHEPLSALDGGADGLEIIRRLVASAALHLQDQGWLLCEVSPEQAPATRELVETTGEFTNLEIADDLGSRPRVVLAQRTSKKPGH